MKQEILDGDRKYLSIYGIYRGKDIGQGWFNKVKAVIVVAFTFCGLVLLTTKTVMDIDDLETVYEVGHMLVTEVGFILKLCLFLNHLPILNGLEESLEEPIFNMATEKQSHLITRAIKRLKSITTFYKSAMVVSVIDLNLFPLIENQLLPVPIWAPFDLRKYRIQLYIFEVISIIITASCNTAIDCIAFALLCIAMTQIQILKENLKECAQRNPSEDYFTQERKIKRRLKLCVLHHIAILE